MFGILDRLDLNVSVPLRGLGSWKAAEEFFASIGQQVSVPLRGLGSWKVSSESVSDLPPHCFSPLAGIRFVESFQELRKLDDLAMFQSPCGD